MTQSNEWVYDPSLIQEQQAVVKIEIDGVEYMMDWDEWKESQEAGRTKAVIVGERLFMVSSEEYELLTEVMTTLKFHGVFGRKTESIDEIIKTLNDKP